MKQDAPSHIKTEWLKPKFENIPDELKQQPWAVWKAEPREGQHDKFNKAPRHPITGIKIGANKPEQFGSFDEAVNAYKIGKWTGIGVLLTGNGIVGIDIDDAVALFAEKPEVQDWVLEALNAGAYCEISPSSKGLRLFISGSIPSTGKKYRGLEIYSSGRFLTVTGHSTQRKGQK